MNTENETVITSKRLSKDTLLYIPVFLAPAIVNILLLMIFTRFFSPSAYGDYTIVVNTTIIVSALLSQWINLSIQRFRPVYKKQGKIADFNEYLLSLLLYISIGFMAAAFMLHLVSPSVLEKFQGYYWPSVLMVISSIYFSTLGAIYQIDLLTRQFRNINVLLSIGKLLFTLAWLFVIKMDAVAFVWAALIIQILVTIPMVRKIELGYLIPKKRLSNETLSFFKTLFQYGFPLIGWYVGTTILNLTDRYMIDYFRPSSEVGIYSANFTIAVQALALICNPLFFAAQPLLLNEAELSMDKKYIEQRISYFTKLFFLISFPFAGFFSIFRNEVSLIILGEKFVEGALIIPILIIGFFAWNLGLYGQLCCQIDKRTKHMFYFVIIAAIVNFCLNLYFIPQYGYVGASVSTTLGFIVYTALLYFSSLKNTKWILPWKTFFKVLILSAILIFITVEIKSVFIDHLLPMWRVIIGSLYFVIYILGLIVIGELPFIKIKNAIVKHI